MIELRGYQQEAAKKITALLDHHRCAYLSGEVRTGKTLTVFEVVKRMKYERVLLVTKKKAIPSIEDDRDAMELTDQVQMTNFEQLPKFAYTFWDAVIIDEAHCVGAYPKESRRYKNLKAIRYSNIILMSGTPSPESFSQLFHQFRLANLWSHYRNFYEWAKNDYVSITEKRVGTGQMVNDYSTANKEKILADIEPYVVRMTQEAAGFETQIEEKIHTVRMKKRTYRLALRIITDGIIGHPGCRSVVADTGAKTMGKLRQIFNGHVLTEEHGAVIFDTSKAEYIKENFHGKLAIMYCFKAEQIMLHRVFGDQATDNPETFNSDPNSVFIGQIQSSREGVNLSSADDLVFLGIDYSALSYLQGRDRASYLGRTRKNKVHYVFAERSIEPRVYETVRQKQTYTVSHYRNDRSGISEEANQEIRDGGMACFETANAEQSWIPRLNIA